MDQQEIDRLAARIAEAPPARPAGALALPCCSGFTKTGVSQGWAWCGSCGATWAFTPDVPRG